MRHFRFFSFLLLAIPFAHAADQVVLTNAGGDSAVVLVDAMYAGVCQNDQPFTGLSPVSIGDAEENADCDGEILVFSSNKAIAVAENPNLQPSDDSVTVALVNRWVVPIHFWVITKMTIPDAEKAILEALYVTYVIDADKAFNDSRAGISFPDPSISYVVDPTWAVDVATMADDVFTGTKSGGEYLIKLDEQISPMLNTINVYAVESSLITGFHISLGDGSSSGSITVKVFFNGSTLGHELGHAFTLDHINFVGIDASSRISGEYCVAFGHYARYDGECDYDVSNLMWAGQSGLRDELTEGQAFRTNFNALSFINGRTPPIRALSEPQRKCPDWLFDSSCPYLALDED